MLNVNPRLMNRQHFLLLCASLFLAMSPGAIRAEPDEAPVRQAQGEAELDLSVDPSELT